MSAAVLAGFPEAGVRAESGATDSPEAREALAALPRNARTLIDAAGQSGWVWRVTWRRASSPQGQPYVDLEFAAKSVDSIIACWHTYPTGTLRMGTPLVRESSGEGGYHDRTLAYAIAVIRSVQGPVTS